MTALTYTGIATMGAGVVLLLLRLVLRRPADGNDRGAADTPMFKASGPVGLWVIAIGALLLILPATSLVRQSGQDRSLAPSRSAATDDGTTSAQLNACRNLSSALAKESSAAEALNGQVKTSGDQPTGIRQPAYDRLAAAEQVTNAAAIDAWGAYDGLHLTPPTDQVIPRVLADLGSFIARLPAEISQKQNAQAARDWGAMQDRPRVLIEIVVPAISGQCSGL